MPTSSGALNTNPMSIVPVVPSVVAGTAAEDTMIINKSCQLRARFTIEQDAFISPLRVVPHPLNRGGDPPKVNRCRGITKDIADYGVDVREASNDAVLVETPPTAENAAEVHAKCCNPDFDAHLAENTLDGKDMCILQGIPVDGGSLSHSHLNVTLRNVQTGRVGCECSRTPDVAGEAKVQCTCGNAIICDDSGRYSMAKIRARDPDWEQLAQGLAVAKAKLEGHARARRSRYHWQCAQRKELNGNGSRRK